MLLQLILGPAGYMQDHALDELQQDVAHKAIADNHVRHPCEQVAGLDVADEVVHVCHEQVVCPHGKLITFARFGADVQKPDARSGVIENMDGVGPGHQGKLYQVRGSHVHVGAGIAQQESAVSRRDQGAHGWSANSRNPVEHKQRG